MAPQIRNEFIYIFSLIANSDIDEQALSAIGSLLESGIMKKMTEAEFWQIRNQMSGAGVQMVDISRLPVDPESVI